MTRKSQPHPSEIAFPSPMSRDELASMSAAELAALKGKLEMELRVISERTSEDTTLWEVELSYVDRALELRKAYEAMTPAHLWN